MATIIESEFVFGRVQPVLLNNVNSRGTDVNAIKLGCLECFIMSVIHKAAIGRNGSQIAVLGKCRTLGGAFEMEKAYEL